MKHGRTVFHICVQRSCVLWLKWFSPTTNRLRVTYNGCVCQFKIPVAPTVVTALDPNVSKACWTYRQVQGMRHSAGTTLIDSDGGS